MCPASEESMRRMRSLQLLQMPPKCVAQLSGAVCVVPSCVTTGNTTDGAPRAQAVVAGDLDGAGTLNGRAGASEFSIGGPDGRGGTAAGANPFELLSASLAACTAMTIRLLARRRKFPLSHVEVAVSYHHGGDGGRDSFERSIRLEGNLGDEERAQLMQAANMCPVGRTLGLSADIRTNDNVSWRRAASYDDDLSEASHPKQRRRLVFRKIVRERQGTRRPGRVNRPWQIETPPVSILLASFR